MKFGMRTPSLKKSLSARTTGRLNRTVKRAVNPVYGKKGMGLINDPKKTIYNKVYSKTTVGVSDIASSFVATAPAAAPPVDSTSPAHTGSTANTAGNVAFGLGGICLCSIFSGNIFYIVVGICLSICLFGCGVGLKLLGR